MKTFLCFARNSAYSAARFASLALSLFFFFLISSRLQAQVYYEDRVLNPFGFQFTQSGSDLVFHSLVDIDGDGDLDDFVSHRTYISPCWQVSAFDFYKNTGSSECPEFTKISDQHFGLPATTAAITFIDADNDGDQDAFIGNHCINAVITYHENKGTAEAPNFSSTPTSAINTTGWGIAFAMDKFGDLDSDGDYDALINGYRPAVFKYVENIGTPSVFNFTAPVDNPFGLSIPSFNSSEWSHFADWDCDGDLDILNAHWQGGTNHNDWKLYIYENAGTPTAPAFLSPVATELLLMPITLGDMDGDGDEDVFSDEFYFRNVANTGCITLPTAGFSTVHDGLTVTFVNESVGQSTACRPLEYYWDFDDGKTSSETSPSHTFATNGTYQVCLTVEDIAGEKLFCDAVIVTASGVYQAVPNNALWVYPNLATDHLTVKLTGELHQKSIILEVINPMGEVVMTLVRRLTDSDAEIPVDISGLVSGAYTVRINNGRDAMVAKFIKIE